MGWSHVPTHCAGVVDYGRLVGWLDNNLTHEPPESTILNISVNANFTRSKLSKTYTHFNGFGNIEALPWEHSLFSQVNRTGKLINSN